MSVNLLRLAASPFGLCQYLGNNGWQPALRLTVKMLEDDDI